MDTKHSILTQPHDTSGTAPVTFVYRSFCGTELPPDSVQALVPTDFAKAWQMGQRDNLCTECAKVMIL